MGTNYETFKAVMANPVLRQLVEQAVEHIISQTTGMHVNIGKSTREVAFCKLCNKALTDPRSIRAGYGPECARQVVSRMKGW